MILQSLKVSRKSLRFESFSEYQCQTISTLLILNTQDADVSARTDASSVIYWLVLNPKEQNLVVMLFFFFTFRPGSVSVKSQSLEEA